MLFFGKCLDKEEKNFEDWCKGQKMQGYSLVAELSYDLIILRN